MMMSRPDWFCIFCLISILWQKPEKTFVECFMLMFLTCLSYQACTIVGLWLAPFILQHPLQYTLASTGLMTAIIERIVLISCLSERGKMWSNNMNTRFGMLISQENTNIKFLSSLQPVISALCFKFPICKTEMIFPCLFEVLWTAFPLHHAHLCLQIDSYSF